MVSSHSARAQYESPGLGPDIYLRPAAENARPWKLWLRAFIGNDDNVQEIGRASTFVGDSSSGFIGLTVEGSYKLVDDSDWVVGAALRFDQLIYLDGPQDASPPGFYATDADDFNYTIIDPAVFVARRFDVGPVPVTARVVYNHRYETAETEGGTFQTLAGGLGAKLTEAWNVDLLYAHGWDDHGVIYAFNHVNNDRDGQRDSVTLSTSYLFNQKRTLLTLAYAVMRNDSDGMNFLYEGQSINLRLLTVLSGPFAAAVQLGYANRDYAGFATPNPMIPPPGRTEMDLYTAGLQLLCKLGPQWTADVFYNYTSYQSNLPLFDSNRSIWGMGLRYDF
ncbi:MAG: hypothetical protein ABL974_12820 [Prosthecobacter sp.]